MQGGKKVLCVTEKGTEYDSLGCNVGMAQGSSETYARNVGWGNIGGVSSLPQ